jgi:hypothetical protein
MSHIVAFPELTGEQLVDLQRLLRSRSTPAGVHRRATLIWELAAGSLFGSNKLFRHMPDGSLRPRVIQVDRSYAFVRRTQHGTR